MKFIDFSPSASPALAEQRDALQKGLGRAVQWARIGCLADAPLLGACLTDQRYDMQFEDSRTKGNKRGQVVRSLYCFVWPGNDHSTKGRPGKET